MSPFSFIATAWKKAVSREDVATLSNDGQSVLSKSDTLFSDSKHAAQAPPTSSEPVTMGASSTSFAKAAKKEGWGAPTATWPSLGV